jgi:hypothetical protein
MFPPRGIPPSLKPLALVAILAALPPPAVQSSSISLPYTAGFLVKNADVVVVATLENVGIARRGPIGHRFGELAVQRVIWGNASPGDRLVFVFKWPRTCPRHDFGDHIGKEAIYSLTRDRGDADRVFMIRGESVPAVRSILPAAWRGRAIYTTWNSDSAVRTVAEESQYRKALSETTAFVRNSLDADLASPIVEIVYRNPGSTSIHLPGIAMRDGRLYLSPSIKLHLSEIRLGKKRELVPVRPSISGMEFDAGLAPITLSPAEQRVFLVNLSKTHPVSLNRFYELSFSSTKAIPETRATVETLDPTGVRVILPFESEW